MQAAKYTINDLGHRQAVDEDGHPVCPDCGRCYKNFGAGSICETCMTEEIAYCEQMQEDFAELFRK